MCQRCSAVAIVVVVVVVVVSSEVSSAPWSIIFIDMDMDIELLFCLVFFVRYTFCLSIDFQLVLGLDAIVCLLPMFMTTSKGRYCFVGCG